MALLGQERIDHIAEQRKKAGVMLAQIVTKLAPQLSYIEVYDLMIGAIEDRARCSVEEIREQSAAVTAKCQNITRIGGGE